MKKLTGALLAICLVGGIDRATAQTTNATQQILDFKTFPQGIVLIGDKAPTEAENKELLEVLNHLDETWWTSGLEQFFSDHPKSPWAASLHNDYASFCRETGRTTKALEQWQAGWDLVKNDNSSAGQKLGGSILANWMDLLSSLGRSDKLKELITVGNSWHFVNPHDRDKFQGAKNSYYLMQLHPEIAYRCGTFALKAVGSKLEPTNDTLEKLVGIPSPTNGFSMAALVDIAKQYGLNMVAVRRMAGQELIVPSVVHWRQNHYAAILDKQDDNYLVSDPTFGSEQWLTAEVINQEASGEFLIPATSEKEGWTQLALADTKKIHGMGLPNDVNDGKDKCCITLFDGQKLCTHCPGMPVWWVSEPYVNLWMADEPISYNTSRGQPVTFQITYKQRDSRPPSSDYLISTAGWNNSWASYIHLNSVLPCANGNCMPQLSSCTATLYLPNGGEVDFSQGQTYDPETRIMIKMQAVLLKAGTDNGDNGIRVIYPDGSQDIYGLGVTILVPAGSHGQGEFMRTRHIDPNGDTTWFQYDAPNLSTYVVTYVVDADGKTNFLTYTSNNYLSSITNAYGLSANFKYDGSGNLTNIIDAQGLSSGISYDTNNFPTALTTPYGKTTFSIFANSVVASTNDTEGNFGGDDLIDRSILVTDPVGANYLYMYRYDCSSASPVNMSPTFSSSDVPTGTPVGTLDNGGGSSTNTLAGVCYRNSFYWGPRQYAGLSTTNINSLVANDYVRGRMRHWLEDQNQLYLTGYLSVERDPSPDGSTEGLKTFYDYQGKLSGYNFCAGTYALPSVRAWRIPNSETHYEYLVFDYFGNITNDITTYTKSGGSVGTRTNQFIYSDNTYTYTLGTWNGSSIINTATSTFTVPNLLSKVIGADGNTIWAYGGFDTVTWTNFFNTGSQTNGTTLASSRVFPDYTTNGLGQVATATYTAGGNPVGYYDMRKSFGGSTNFNYGTLLAVTFPGFNKVTSTTSVGGLTTTNIYNSNGFLAQTIDLQIGRTNSFGYTANGMVGAFTNELGLNVTAAWDNLLRLTSIQFPDGTYISNSFNKLDLGGQRDRLGNWTTYSYDGARHLIFVTNANNAVTMFSWCGCGALTAIIDALTNITSFNYDNQGNLTNVTYPDASALNYQYNLAAWPTSFSDGAGRSFQLGYNNQGLITGVSNSVGQFYSTIYDIKDRQISITDANAVTLTNNYDLIDELLTQKWPDGTSDRFGYSASGLVVYTNRDNQITMYGRDTAGRLISITNANSEVVSVAYNPASEIINLIDGLNHTTSWQYNQFGWLTNKTDGLNRNAFRYSYNVNGWITNRWTPEKGNTDYTFDNVGNLTSIIYPQSTLAYAYNLLNQLTNMTDAVGNTKFTYTASGLLASEINPWTSNTVSYSYSQGLETAMSLSQSSGSWSQTYGYDSIWRMTNIVSPAGTFNYSYNFQPVSSLISQITLPNGGYITNSYNNLARLTQTTLNNYWGHALDSYSYQYDAVGLRTNITRNLGLTTSSVSAGYDSIGQLTSWIAKETGGTLRQNEQLAFGYDAAHNLHSRTSGGMTQTFNTDAANELTSVTRSGSFTLNGATPAPATNVTVNGLAAQIYGDLTFAATNLALVNGGNTFTNVARNVYGVAVTNTFTVTLPSSTTLSADNNGSLTNDGTRSFGYDSENQLTNIIVSGQWKSEFVYDGLNRRRIARDYTWNGSAWIKTNEVRYIYDGGLLIQERDTNNNVLVTYTRGLDISGNLGDGGGIGGLLARTDVNGSTYYHSDGEGNVTALMDMQENISARYLYNPYGKLLGKWGATADANTMRFSSKPNYRDIYDFGFRPYSADFDRFLNPDPIQEAGGFNLYRFVRNNPINFVDPLGQDGEATLALDPTLLMDDEEAAAWRLEQQAVRKAEDTVKKQLEKDGAKAVKKSCKSYEKLIKEHEDEIANNPNSRDVPHWKTEIRNWKRLLKAGQKLLNEGQNGEGI